MSSPLRETSSAPTPSFAPIQPAYHAQSALQIARMAECATRRHRLAAVLQDPSGIVAGELGHRSRAAIRRGPRVATEDTCPAPADLNAEATAERSFETRVGVRGRWREYAADRKRRMLAKWLRPTANRAQPAHYHARTSEPLLPHGVGAVRTGLLELATRLEHRPNPTPECVAARDDHQVGRRKQPPTAAGGSALSMIGSGGAVVVSQRRARRSQTARTS